MKASAVARDPVAEVRSAFAEEAAFRAWYERTLPRVYAFVASRCGDAGPLAEEIVQQTFVEAVRRRDAFDGRADVVSWLCAIARHKLADHYRRVEREERRGRRLLAETLVVAREPEPWQSAERRIAVEAALARLPAAQRAALVFRYLDGLGVAEVARLLDRSEPAAESLLARARDAFKRAYGEVDDGS